MRLKFIGICNDHFIVNLFLSVSMKEFEKSVIIWWSYGKNLEAYFLDHPVLGYLGYVYTSVVRCSLQAEQLKRSVEEVAGRQPHFGERLPRRWFHCDQLLDQLTSSGLNFCSLAQVDHVTV